jgi:hypothetical protein
VTCRLTGGGARSPFSLVDVRVTFDNHAPGVLFVAPGDMPPPLSARIDYTGTGRLTGRWEVVLAGEEVPGADELLSEGSRPREARADRRRFTQLERFSVFLPPQGSVILPGPDPRRLPTMVEGTYRILLRIEATDDRETDSDLGAAGAGTGVVHSGGVAGFAMPVLPYVVAGEGARTTGREAASLRLLAPSDSQVVDRDSTLAVVWSATTDAEFYRVEFETELGRPILSAILPRTARRYDASGSLIFGATARALRWRVVALDLHGTPHRHSVWRSLRLTTGSAPQATGRPASR